TKDELLERVWGKVIVEENTLQAHISALRKVLGPQAIATVTGHGYRFTPEVVRAEPAPPARKHNLPFPITSFVGREREMQEVKRLLGTARLLTLTGSGGCGKTRMALHLAEQLAAGFEDGVWLVELAALGDPALVANTIADALQLKEQSGKPLTETLCAHL